MNEEIPSSPPAVAVAPPAAGVSFADMNLRPELMQALAEMGYAMPMEVQAATVPLVRAGRDLMVQSRTGSGKTAAFGIPMLDGVVKAEEKFVQAIVLLPTRELAIQVAAEISRIAAHSGATVVPVYGGAPMGRQIELLRAGAQILCGTPGRVLDHLRRGTLKLDRVRCAVLDECDEMLSMGFQEDIEAILDKTPKERQTLLFSATLPDSIQRLARRFLRNPEMVKLSAAFVGVHEIRHVYYTIPGGGRESELLRVLTFENPERAIIFCNTRDETGRVAQFLRTSGLDAEAISSDLSQTDREQVMTRMRAGGIRFLVATDVAARGIDLENLPCVINYTFPESPEVYIHRTGRTGRAGKHGTAISLIGPAEVGGFYYVKLLYKIKPEERSLPSETEIRSRREGERVVELRAAFPEDVAAEWRTLARRLSTAPDGERLIAAVLARAIGGALAGAARTSSAVVAPPRVRATLDPYRGATEGPAPSLSPPRDRSPREGAGDGERSGRFAGRGATGPRRAREPVRGGDRDRFGDRDRGRERPAERAESQPRRSDSPRPEPATSALVAAPPVAEQRPASSSLRIGDDFSAVWGHEPATPDAPPTTAIAPAPTPAFTPARVEPPALAPGEARLFLNLGRKDNATLDDVRGLLAEAGASVAPENIDLMNTHSYINVPAVDAERLSAALSAREHNGRKLQCEPARPRRR